MAGRDEVGRVAIAEILDDEISGEVTSRDAQWESFSALVMKRITEEAESDAFSDEIAVLLRGEVQEELDARSEEMPAFAASVMARIEAETEAELAQPFSLADALEDEMRAAVVDREKDWSRFSAGVLSKASDTPLDERAVQQLKRDVEEELEDVESKFQGGFSPKLERAPSFMDRARQWLQGHRVFGGLSLAGATAALLVVLVVRPPMATTPEQPIALGEVSVEEVSFEGTVTVMQGSGATVVWLAEPTS